MADHVQVLDDSDRFWDSFWQSIDQAQDLVFITTYDMDHKLIAGITLQKLAKAARRGVKVILIIDDLNYFASAKMISKFEEAGGTVIKNQPFTKALDFIVDGKFQKFFNRNHQKVMLVDETVFCGSLNVADPYSGARYGDQSFRDLNIILRNEEAKSVRHFFKDLLIQNEKYLPEQFHGEKLTAMFDKLDTHFASKKKPVAEPDPFFFEDEAEQALEAEKVNVEKDYTFEFLNEMPPQKTEITTSVLEILKKAEKKIRIIQPYVQNVVELENELIDAMENRGVEVEIITARKRDQPIYKTFLNSDLFQELLAKGAKVYEEPYKFLHMKSVEVDDGRFLTIGSLNQDHCSFYQNNEANVLLSAMPSQQARASGKLSAKDLYWKQYKDIWERLKKESRLVDPDESYTWQSYLENKFWRIQLWWVRYYLSQREIREIRRKRKELENE